MEGPFVVSHSFSYRMMLSLYSLLQNIIYELLFKCLTKLGIYMMLMVCSKVRDSFQGQCQWETVGPDLPCPPPPQHPEKGGCAYCWCHLPMALLWCSFHHLLLAYRGSFPILSQLPAQGCLQDMVRLLFSAATQCVSWRSLLCWKCLPLQTVFWLFVHIVQVCC